MGYARWSASDWSTYKTAHVAGKTRSAVFKNRSLKDEYDPAKIDFRESCDSDKNPESTPVILASDVTGSMGHIAHKLMQDGLNTVIEEIYDRKPISDPHIMGMAIGDAYIDSAPLQVTQFESDIMLAEQVRSLYIEGGGGGNFGESYALAWLFAAMKTKIDSVKKRNQKGFLFTIGDEPNLDGVTKAQAKKFLNIDLETDATASDILTMTQRNWEVFHVALVNEGYCRSGRDRVVENWKQWLPERTIELENIDDLAETIVSVIQVHRGAAKDKVSSSWSGSTAVTVSKALRNLPAHQGGASGITRLAA